jgi:predicted secreted hydrolase
VLAAGLAWLAVLAWPTAEGPAASTLWAVDDLLGGGDDGFARVTGAGPFAFPRDHGPHPAYRHEWWYLTGQLEDPGGRRFGFQVTFFRFGITPTPAAVEAPSAWRSESIYLAHFGLTDVAGARLLASERFARPVLGLAGAQAEPFAVWVEEWRLDGMPGSTFPLRLELASDAAALALELQPTKPLVAHGDGGTSRKGPGAGNATRYYALTRLAASGRLRLAGRDFSVRGSAWLDREWGSSALGAGVQGWDWFGLQLDDGRDLMLYRLRRDDGSADPFSAGSVVAPDGAVTPLAADDFSVQVLDRWRAADGVVYPARWRLRVPGHGLDLEVTPLVADQELRLAVRYWEGAVAVAGSVGGRGYAELTGYAGPVREGQPR